MKKLLFVCILGASCIPFSACSNSKSMSTNSSTYLSSNTSTTSILSTTSNIDNTSDSESDWILKHYVDEFGDDTNEKYVSYVGLGTFSNTATTDSDLIVYVMVDREDVSIKLLEYGNSLVNNSYSHGIRYDIITKDESGNKFPCSGYMNAENGDRIYLSDNTKGHFLNHMKTSSEDLRFHIVESDRPSTYYDFTISPSNFKEIYEQLN